jgi:hypothetical protein
VFKNAPVAVVPHWVRSMDAPAEYSPKSQRERRVVSIRVVPLLCCKGSNCVQCGEPILFIIYDPSSVYIPFQNHQTVGFSWVLPFNLLRNCGHWRAILLRFSRLWGLLLHDGFESGRLGLHPDVAVMLQHLL